MRGADLLRTLPGSNLRVAGLPIMFDGERPPSALRHAETRRA
jgi:hypothetical protein